MKALQEKDTCIHTAEQQKWAAEVSYTRKLVPALKWTWLTTGRATEHTSSASFTKRQGRYSWIPETKQSDRSNKTCGALQRWMLKATDNKCPYYQLYMQFSPTWWCLNCCLNLIIRMRYMSSSPYSLLPHPLLKERCTVARCSESEFSSNTI